MDSTEYEVMNSNVTNSDDELICPLCMELLDETDRNLFPCNCGYQVCLWCLHYIRNTMGNKCPACRQDYIESNFKYNSNVNVTTNKDHKLKDIINSKDKLINKKQQQQQAAQQQHTSAGTSSSDTAENKDDPNNLKDVRIIQRNLVYVVGIPLKLSKKEILKKYEYFGQYGKIIHIVVNKNNTYSHYGVPSYTAYITYSKKTEAINAIQGINSKQIDNKYLRASYGTTKYCSYFLKGLKCYNNDCYYLHEYGDESDLYVKDQFNSATFFTNTAPREKELGKDTGPSKETSTAVRDSFVKDAPKDVKEKDSSNTWVNIVNGIKYPTSSVSANKDSKFDFSSLNLSSLNVSGSNSGDSEGDTKDEVNNIFNIPMKYCLYKYNKSYNIIKLNNVNINKLNSLDTVKKLYQWTYNTGNTGAKVMNVNKEETSSSASTHNLAGENGERENVFMNNELYVNDIINKIRRHTMLIDNLSKQYLNSNPNNTKLLNKAELNNGLNNLNANATEGDDEAANNKLEMSLFKLLQTQLKRNENYINHLKLISSDS